MANNVLQVKRTSVAGRTPNTTGSYVTNSQYISAGELALNMADGILYSSNGSASIVIGANVVNKNVTGNLTVKGIIANGSIGSAGDVLSSNGSGVYWTSPGAASVNVAAQYTWTNVHTFSNTVNMSVVNVGTQIAPSSNTVGTALGTTTQRWVVLANTIGGTGDWTTTGNVGFGAAAVNYSKLYTYTSVTADSSTYNHYGYHQDNNTALTLARTRYGIYGDIVNFSQNKNVDGVTTYSSNYRAVVGDVTNGSSASGGDARAGEMIGGNFRIYNYANGVNANTISNAKGVQGIVYSYGSGVISSAFGSITFVGIGNTTATGNITTAYGYYSEISSNTAATIGTGYLFYGKHEGSTTTSKFGVYVTGESNNYFSSNVTIAGSIRMISANNIANADFRVINSTANVFYAAANGNLGVATVSPTFKLQVNGSFAATTKSFVIDHPTQEGKFLRYGSLEGPENGVYVRGRLTSESVIHLPKYWWNLVDERTITVNLTPYGKSQDIWVQSVSAYHINLNQPADCFYTVFAERKDIDKLVVEF